MELLDYRTDGGIRVRRTATALSPAITVEDLIDRLDDARGVVLTSDYEFPGRHRRWSVGFADPPLVITARGRTLRFEALNARGEVLLAAIGPRIGACPAVRSASTSPGALTVSVAEPEGRFTEEDRGRRPSVFSVLRELTALFAAPQDEHLGLYGAFGYDLVFQVDDVRPRVRRHDQRDLVLYLPDELTVVDLAGERAVRYAYEFACEGRDTAGLERSGAVTPYVPGAGPARRDHAPGEYANAVEDARSAFRRGDLFEVVLSQAFSRPSPATPAELFHRLRRRNRAPYAALMNLGEAEYLISSSPAMYVRVEERDGLRVETCPISGTVRRGGDALRDADQILGLLNSAKDASELTMCTDVDRNDKSRVCLPGTVEVVGRRQIEMYSDVIHTVDHIVGRLRPGHDAIDAFLAHMWAVTVTGAPKLWAMRFIERHERTPRRWYGGATGMLGFDGRMTTGITLRTLQLKDGVATVRAGATLLFDSDPVAEERESELKAGLFLDVLRPDPVEEPARRRPRPASAARRILVIDHEDSFVHTLAGYLRQTGAGVTTVRAPIGAAELAAELDRVRPDLLVLSPGPGRPSDFGADRTVRQACERGLPIFGVCLGLQAVVEALGGELARLPNPVHGKTSVVRVRGGRLFRGMPRSFEVGRYHSLHAPEDSLPGDLLVTADADGIVMAVEHRDLPIAATQFHPESIMTAREEIGLRLLANVVDVLTA